MLPYAFLALGLIAGPGASPDPGQVDRVCKPHEVRAYGGGHAYYSRTSAMQVVIMPLFECVEMLELLGRDLFKCDPSVCEQISFADQAYAAAFADFAGGEFYRFEGIGDFGDLDVAVGDRWQAFFANSEADLLGLLISAQNRGVSLPLGGGRHATFAGLEGICQVPCLPGRCSNPSPIGPRYAESIEFSCGPDGSGTPEDCNAVAQSDVEECPCFELRCGYPR